MKMSNKILIIGFGRVGSAVADILATDYSIVGIKRSQIQSNHKLLYIDVSNRAQCRQLIADSEPVAILIIVTPLARTEQGYRDSYLKIANAVCASCKKLQQLPLIGFMSSTSVYSQNQGQLVDESSNCQPQNYNGKVLLATEQLIIESGLPYVIFRASGIYRNLSKVNTERITSKTSDSWCNVVYQDDVAAAIAHLITRHLTDKIASGSYIISDSTPYKASQLLQKKAIAIPSHWQHNKTIQGKILSNKKLLKTGFKFKYAARFQ